MKKTYIIWITIAITTIVALLFCAPGCFKRSENIDTDFISNSTENHTNTDSQINSESESEEIINTAKDYIEISSREEVYALSRILSPSRTKAVFLGTSYDINRDLGQFEIPEDIIDVTAKIEYLSTAKYKLTSNISLTLQRRTDTAYFLGIGSKEYPFKGVFDGNGKTIILQTSENIKQDGNMNSEIGLFGSAESAEIFDTNIVVANDILLDRCTTQIYMGTLVGYAKGCNISECNITISNAKFGVDFNSTETFVYSSRIGGLIGGCELSTIKNCTVQITDGTIYAKGYNVTQPCMYANFSVGGIIGFSYAGSDNKENIGRVGNQLLNCKFISNNTTQRDVIFASIESGDEVDAGGLVGCTFNNFVAKNCSVQISKGNIIAEKRGTTDTDSDYGTQAAGIIGRLEHTGEIYNCTVDGNYLHIFSRSPENYSTAGGIVGCDMGPYHKNKISINKCSFNGNGTSTIVLDIKAYTSVNKWNGLGGISGVGVYIAKDCKAENVTLINKSVNIEKCFVGGVFGLFRQTTGLWAENKYFTPDHAEIQNCASNNVIIIVSDNVLSGGVYGKLS